MGRNYLANNEFTALHTLNNVRFTVVKKMNTLRGSLRLLLLTATHLIVVLCFIHFSLSPFTEGFSVLCYMITINPVNPVTHAAYFQWTALVVSSEDSPHYPWLIHVFIMPYTAAQSIHAFVQIPIRRRREKGKMETQFPNGINNVLQPHFFFCVFFRTGTLLVLRPRVCAFRLLVP